MRAPVCDQNLTKFVREKKKEPVLRHKVAMTELGLSTYGTGGANDFIARHEGKAERQKKSRQGPKVASNPRSEIKVRDQHH